MAVADVGQFGHGLTEVPRGVAKPANLKWELPFAAATGVLIGVGDEWAADRIQSLPLQQTAAKWSNIGLGAELGASGVTWIIGCATHRPYAAESGFKALEAAGLGLGVDLGLKVAFNRQYPYQQHSTGEFWEGGKSFPSGHTVTSFALASALAHRYPHNPWIKWGSYALATGVSLSRLPAKKHFPSDVLVGVPIGYFIGRYVAEH
jgi:membrane-associated phospholipid phosphatase